MRIGSRGLLAVAAGLSVVVSANSPPESARSELQLELAELLFDDDRHWEAIPTYDRAKRGAKPEQLVRASSGLLRSLLAVAEYGRAYREALFLRDLRPTDPESQALYADGLWASGLFEEAESAYREILASNPASSGAHDGLARSLLARNRLEEAWAEVQVALAQERSRPEVYHTLGSIYRRLNRFQDAADAFEEWLGRLPDTGKTERTAWARAEVRFLRSFGDRLPLEVMGAPDAVHTIPFCLVNDKIIVSGRVNGQNPIDLVVDTGAEQMVLSKETAQMVGIRPITNTISAGVGDVGIRHLELGRVNSLEVGSLQVRNLPAIIKNPPLTGLPTRRVADSISPLVFGLSTVIDYETRQLVLARHLPDEPADIELPMRINRLAVVRGVVNREYPGSFVVDTGGEVISISRGTANTLDMVPVRHIPLRVFGTSGWDPDAFLLPGVHLAFDDITYENFPVVVLNLHRPSALLGFHIGGIVGHKFLSNYRVTLDMERALLRLAK